MTKSLFGLLQTLFGEISTIQRGQDHIRWPLQNISWLLGLKYTSHRFHDFGPVDVIGIGGGDPPTVFAFQ
jgi:hypothetical protein